MANDSVKKGETDKSIDEQLLELCPSCCKHDSWSSCVCNKLEQAYELGRKAGLERERELRAEIEFINKNCDNLNEVINDCGTEIRRLKGLIEAFHDNLWQEGRINSGWTIEKSWQEYKTENNL